MIKMMGTMYPPTQQIIGCLAVMSWPSPYFYSNPLPICHVLGFPLFGFKQYKELVHHTLAQFFAIDKPLHLSATA